MVIPKSLYLDWQRCFIFHRLSLESRKQNKISPIWLDGERIAVVSSSSIDKTNVVVDKGEMSFNLFDYDASGLDKILQQNINPILKIKALSDLLGKVHLPTLEVEVWGSYRFNSMG